MFSLFLLNLCVRGFLLPWSKQSLTQRRSLAKPNSIHPDRNSFSMPSYNLTPRIRSSSSSSFYSLDSSSSFSGSETEHQPLSDSDNEMELNSAKGKSFVEAIDTNKGLLSFSELDELEREENNINSNNSDQTNKSSNDVDNEVGTKVKHKNYPFMARIVEWILKRVVFARAKLVSGLTLRVMSPTNRDILRGKISGIFMKFDKIHLANLRVSGGGTLILQQLDLRVRRFLFQNLQSLRHPYKIYGDFLLTQDDISNSPFIRHVIQVLMKTILERVLAATLSASRKGILTVNISRVMILNRRLVAQGDLLVPSLEDAGLVNKMSFEISTGAGVRDSQVIFLRDIEVVLNPDNAFLRTILPIQNLLSAPIDVDIGENCRIENFVIAKQSVWVRAAAIISPPLSRQARFAMEAKEKIAALRGQVDATQKKALYKYDLANVLSDALRLQGGVVIKSILQKNN